MGESVLEIAIPFETLGAHLGSRLWIQAQAAHGDEEINRVPTDQPLELELAPSPNEATEPQMHA